MKYLAKSTVSFVLPVFFIFFFSCTSLAVEKGEVDWYSYQEGVAQMSSEGKMGFLHFYTDWCGYCKKIDEETFSRKNISEYLNDNFVPIRVNADEERELAARYEVTQYPLNLFVSEDVAVIAGRPGFIPADQMIDILRYMHTRSFETMTFTDFLERN
jgi:thioredoxin-related protein